MKKKNRKGGVNAAGHGKKRKEIIENERRGIIYMIVT
jgi:hypothetical protein